VTALTQKVRQTEAELERGIRLKEEKKTLLERDLETARKSWEHKRREKSDYWAPVLEGLRREVDGLAAATDELQRRSAEESREAERLIAGLEQESAAWQEKEAARAAVRAGEEDADRRKFQGQADALAAQLEDKKADAALKEEGAEREIQKLSALFAQEEEREKRELAESESVRSAQSSQLQTELEELQRRFRAQETQHSQELDRLQKRRSELELALASRAAAGQTDELRRQRDAEKARRPLEQKVRELERRLAEEERAAQARLQAKEAQIRTLQTRLQLRQDRRDAEKLRRRQRIEALEQELARSLAQWRARAEESLRRRENELSERTARVEQLSASVEAREAEDRNARTLAREQIEREKAELEARARELEGRAREQRASWDELQARKEAEFRTLSERLEASDAGIEQDAEQRQAWSAWTRELAEQLRRAAAAADGETRPSGVSDGRKAEAQRLLQQGFDAYTRGRYAEALGALARCVELDPAHESAWHYRVLCFDALGLAEDAAAAARRVLDLNPDNSVVKKWLAEHKGEEHHG
jgi:peptidoglycan DL-endopeptidase RipA